MNSIREVDWIIIHPAETFSFLAGVVSVSLIWYFQERQRKRQVERRRQERQRQRRRQRESHSLRQERLRLLQQSQESQKPQQQYEDEEEIFDDGHNHAFEFYDEQKLILQKKAVEEDFMKDNDDEDDNAVVGDDDTIQASISSWMNPVYQSVEDIKSSMEDITCRIGELPASFFRRRITLKRWPWDRITRNPSIFTSDTVYNLDELSESSSVSYSTDGREADTAEGTAAAVAAVENLQQQQQRQEQQQQTKSGSCIGSIFGLDVGGTLAKLVYFEQKPNDVAELIHNREYNYQIAVSAQAFIKAQRVHPDVHKGRSSPRRSSSFTQRNSNNHADWNSAAFPGMRRHVATCASIGSSKHYSQKSHDDLKISYTTRRELLSDDLNVYAKTVRLPSSQFSSVESLRRAASDSADPARAAIGNNINSKNDKNINGVTDSGDSQIKKSKSMLEFSKSHDHAQALDRFYNFAKRLDSYHGAIKDNKLSFYSRELGGEFHFIRFETRKMSNAMELIRSNNLHLNICEMGATGGGAHKYASDWDRELGIKMKKEQELDSLVAGMQFVLSTVVGECYTYRPKRSKVIPPTIPTKTPIQQRHQQRRHHQQQNTQEECNKNNCDDGAPESNKNSNSDKCYSYYRADPRNPPSSQLSFSISSTTPNSSDQEEKNAELLLDSDSDSDEIGDRARDGDEWWWSRKVQHDAISYSSTYPYLLVTIGTGVSVLRVDGPRKHERISGSTIGGGTYWGLIRLLTDVEDFEDVMRLAERGDPSKVDMMVGDIYGDNSDALEKLGLPSNIVASSFGKLVSKENPAAGLKQEDLARALLCMVTTNIGQVAYLNAKLHKTSRIYFVGNFLRNNKFSQRRLSFAIDYWSKGTMEALFLKHEGYFGSLGAFLLSQNIKTNTFEHQSPSLSKVKFGENNIENGEQNPATKSKTATKQKRPRSSSISSLSSLKRLGSTDNQKKVKLKNYDHSILT